MKINNKLWLFFLMCLPLFVHAQKYSSESGTITFFSKAAIEDIEAENKKGVSIFNSATGDIAFSVPVNEFQFRKSLMQEHFNEKYLESDTYPKASFQGKLTAYDLTGSGIQNVTATGKLTIHGVTRDVTTPATLEVKNGKVVTTATFIVKLEEFKIKIPQMMWQNIAEQVEVSVTFVYKPQ